MTVERHTNATQLEKKKQKLIAAVLMSAWSVKRSRFFSACGEMQHIFE